MSGRDVNDNFFGVLTAVGLETGFAKACRENTSNAVNIFPYFLLGGSFGHRSNCIMISGPESVLGKLVKSGVVCELSISLI